MPTKSDPGTDSGLPEASLDRETLRSHYREVREATRSLAAPLSAEDCSAQSMEDASPAKWHLAHTTWFFETFVLERALSDFRPFHPEFRVLFNSYYHGVGDQHPRPERGLLTRPSLEAVMEYRRHVDRELEALLERTHSAEFDGAVELGLEHEQQHQELLLTDVKHLLSRNPMRPAYKPSGDARAAADKPLEWCRYEEQVGRVGHDEHGFSFDNERPRHRVFLDAFELASRPVTNADYLAFMSDGGYERPELWLSDGWATVCHEGWESPLYWEPLGDPSAEGYGTLTLSGFRELHPQEPVCHVSYYEADAFARWMGARLPSEAEWEIGACRHDVQGNFVESGRLHPAPIAAAVSSDAPGPGETLWQIFGDVWEWTQSAYAPYPGFRPLADTFGEYNGKFMSNQMVLRGGSCVTPRSHVRASYRNFFYPHARWQFSGIRLARDASS